MNSAAEILARALELPGADRADIAYQLLVSLEPEGSEPDPGHEAALLAEIEARSRELHEGRAVLHSWEEVRDRLRSKTRVQHP